MNKLIAFVVLVFSVPLFGAGAPIPWTTYEAENMTISGGTILGPRVVSPDKNVTVTNTVDMEASGGECVKLNSAGAYVQFTAQASANAIVVRYCVPDSADGVGLDSNLSLYVNGTQVATLPVTSRYSWRYGGYPFTNNPGDGNPRNFFDEVRLKGISINPNDTVRIQKTAADAASYCIIDLVDLESIPAELSAPANSLSVMNYGAGGNGTTDDTNALQNCINDARNQGKNVWIPAGTYMIAGDMNNIQNITIQGAGMWYTTLVGDPNQYNSSASKQVRFNGGGNNIHISDFAIVGKLNHRNDSDANDGFSEFYGTGSTISRIWVEHTKTGAWIANSSGLVIDGCRIRNTIADGINLCVGVRSSTIQNCTVRGNGDDCFAMWPATYTAQTYAPGLNIIQNCTGQLNSLGNGGAIYGGESNTIQDCVFQDIPYGCGVLIAGTFPVGNNVFTGTTVAQRCNIVRSGGFDSGWNAWRAALTLCPQNLNISGVNINNITITNSLSYAMEIVSPGSNSTQGVLSNATMSNVNISGYGLGVKVYAANPYTDGVFGVWARSDAVGSLNVSNLTVNGSQINSMPTSGTDLANQSNSTNGVQNFTFLFSGGPPPPPAPAITSALTGAGTVGKSFSYQITASNSPASYNATNLPSGLSVNTVTGSITGTPTATGTFNVTISATNAGGTGSATLILTIAGISPTITSQPGDASVVAGQTATFSITATGTPPPTYQWQKNGTNIGGATSASYTTPATSTSDNNATFKVLVTNSAGSVTSNSATLTVNTAAVAPTITAQPANASVVAGQTATFSVTATATPAPTYQWQKNGTNIGGATSASYTTPATSTSDNNATFKVVVTNSAGSVTSNAATLIVNQPTTETSYGGKPWAIPGTIEAENFDLGGEGVAYHDTDASNNGGQYRLSDSVDIELCSDSTGTYDVGWVAAGEWLNYTVNVNTTGVYSLSSRLASPGSGGAFHIEFDGANKTGPIAVPNTGAWQTYASVATTGINLSAGQHIMHVSFDTNSSTGYVGNFNFFVFTLTQSLSPTVSINAPANNASFTAPASIAITANASESGGAISKVDFYNGSALLGTSTGAPYTYNWANVATGTYTLTAKATDSTNMSATSGVITVVVVTPSSGSGSGSNPNPPPPVIGSGATPSSGTATIGQSLTFSVSASSSDGGTLTYSWDFGDGSTASGSSVNHVFSTAGTFAVVVTITDSAGGTVNSSTSVNVSGSSGGSPGGGAGGSGGSGGSGGAATVIAVNSGGGQAGSFNADGNFSGTSHTYSTSNSINTASVMNPAPQAVYQTERWGNFTYSLGGLTAGAVYTVRLHFAEIYWNSAGQRVFNVSINGQAVLANFDIFSVAGGKFIAIVKEFSATADANGKVTIAYTKIKDNAKCSGIEIMSGSGGIAAVTQAAGPEITSIDLGTVQVNKRFKIMLEVPTSGKFQWSLPLHQKLPKGLALHPGALFGHLKSPGTFTISLNMKGAKTKTAVSNTYSITCLP